MRAVILEAPGTQPALHDLPEPSDAPLVRVRASSVNPVDNAIAAGMLSAMIAHEYPIVLGRDFAGVVERAGASFAEGDEVFGFVTHANPTVHDGSWAELIAVGSGCAAVPDGVELSAAGAAPLAAITALAGIDALELSDGETVLIVGATGGVGSFAVQLAARAGATVIASALPQDQDYLRALGVDELVDRDGSVVAEVLGRHPDGVDAVFDLVSYAPGAYDGAIKEGGRLASPLGAAGEGPGRGNVMAVATPENLQRLAELLAGGLTVPIQDVYPLERAPDALQALANGHTQGKLAIAVE